MPDGLFAGSLHLSSSATITNVRILVSDLQDVTGDQRARDPIPASNITLLPAADSLIQLAVQTAKPAAAGVYYHWATYLVGELLLSAVGLNTLYVNNPTFGANCLTDYLSLLVFGLGAETTFASVAHMLRRGDAGEDMIEDG